MYIEFSAFYFADIQLNANYLEILRHFDATKFAYNALL